MTDDEMKILRDLHLGRINFEEFTSLYPIEITNSYLIRELGRAIDCHDVKALAYLLSVFYKRGFFSELCKYLTDLMIQSWHKEHENIAMVLQFDVKCPDSVDNLIKAMEMKYKYLFDRCDYEPFVTKCMYAIADLGTDYSKQKLTELSLSEDPILAEAAKFQLDRLAEEALQAESIDENTRDNTDHGLEGLSPEKRQKLEEMLDMDKGTLTPEMCREFDKQYIHSKNKKKSTDS
ncbi:MAG TPA: hypothetical protein EYP36_08840 [Calditrichaeota bacterium]|nr:hypothetical protein [Calditrichota bacterium]